ncbi:MAG: hypothetical protein H7836_16490 [Magnetococcus sp. YQC-3]
MNRFRNKQILKKNQKFGQQMKIISKNLIIKYHLKIQSLIISKIKKLLKVSNLFKKRFEDSKESNLLLGFRKKLKK